MHLLNTLVLRMREYSWAIFLMYSMNKYKQSSALPCVLHSSTTCFPAAFKIAPDTPNESYTVS